VSGAAVFQRHRIEERAELSAINFASDLEWRERDTRTELQRLGRSETRDERMARCASFSKIPCGVARADSGFGHLLQSRSPRATLQTGSGAAGTAEPFRYLAANSQYRLLSRVR
jgi:hypothetical protein